MATRSPLTSELISKIADGIAAIPPKPASRRELDLLTAGIEAQVRAAQERGSTYDEIAEQITRNGYPIKSSTLRTAMQRRAKSLDARKARGKQPPRQVKGAAHLGVSASSPGGIQP
jgi:hypothetical protein